MREMISVDGPLNWREIASVAEGARLGLSEPARERIVHARRIVDSWWSAASAATASTPASGHSAT